MQRSIEYDVALKQASADANDNDQQPGKTSWFLAMSKTGKVVFAVIVVVAVLLIALTMLIIIKIASQKEDDFSNREYYDEANESFVFSESNDETETNSEN